MHEYMITAILQWQPETIYIFGTVYKRIGHNWDEIQTELISILE